MTDKQKVSMNALNIFKNTMVSAIQKTMALSMDPSLIVCLGTGSAEELAHLKTLLTPQSTVLYLNMSSTTTDTQLLDAEGRIVQCGKDPGDLFREKLAVAAQLVSHRVRFLSGQCVDTVLKEELIGLIRDSAFNNQFLVAKGLPMLRSMIMNIPAMVSSRGHVFQQPLSPRRPAVVCGAGPSLVGQLDELRAIRNRVLLISVGHAYPVLQVAGLVPDIVVEGDSYCGRNWPESIRRVECVLFAAPHLDPSVTRRFSRIVWAGIPWDAVLATASQLGVPLHPVYQDKTVTLHALETARLMECPAVAMLGQDLCLADSGRMYADESVGEKGCVDDEVFPVAGNEREIVQANTNLIIVREAIERYVELLPSLGAGKPVPPLVNCTQGGARIAGVPHQRLHVWASEMAQRTFDTGDVIGEIPVSGPEPCTVVAEWCREWELWMAKTGEVLNVVKRLIREFKRPEQRPAVLQRIVRELAVNDDHLQAWMAQSALQTWIYIVRQYVDKIMDEWGRNNGIKGPTRDFQLLARRLELYQNLSMDVWNDLKWCGEVLSGSATEPRQPLVFDSMRKLAAMFLRQCCSPWAEWLERGEHRQDPDGFRLYWNDLNLPWLEFVDERGGWHPYAPFLNGFQNSVAEVERFKAAVTFDEKRHALIVLAPGNWIHVATWLQAVPALRLLVVEPWPDLFATLCRHISFLHLVPPTLRLVMADDRWDTWKTSLKRELEQLRREGWEPLVFIPESVRRLPAVLSLAAEVRAGMEGVQQTKSR
jgi:hypothetical protein